MEFNFKTITTSFVIILATSANAQTQTYKVSGTVNDNNGKAVELATVSLNNDLVTSTVAGDLRHQFRHLNDFFFNEPLNR